MSLVEIIVLNDEDARAAEAHGADRLELVSAIGEGGLTPSYGIIKTVVKSVKIPVMVMIRPHSYSFTYREQEWAALREDIKIARELGAAGIVFGATMETGTLDSDLLGMVLEESKGMSVTFHRAIDAGNTQAIYRSLCEGPFRVDRVLTSGGRPTAIEGADTIKNMMQIGAASAHAPIIMPGSGLTVENIVELHKDLQALEYHFGSAVRFEGSFLKPINGKVIEKIKRVVH
ncbi:copper homeostasis protein CutC [Bacillus sp. FJAT-29814]|uniref:copper homeostasis protein CutC n=1 Tax=Bacillus sp. FJAT-29814 TaxID=1729688 RepID=UPI00082A1FF0|nr:copper homeostasis protein CutC [Bacillus sp. FJAT-29814]